MTLCSRCCLMASEIIHLTLLFHFWQALKVPKDLKKLFILEHQNRLGGIVSAQLLNFHIEGRRKLLQGSAGWLYSLLASYALMFF